MMVEGGKTGLLRDITKDDGSALNKSSRGDGTRLCVFDGRVDSARGRTAGMCLSGLRRRLRDESGAEKGEAEIAQLHRATPTIRTRSLCGSSIWETAREQLPDFF